MRKHSYNAIVYKEESRLFYGAVLSCICVFSTYMYFVSSSIVHVVMRKEVDAQISSFGTSVGQLEAQYIEMQHSVSSDIATQQGFIIAEDKIFIDKGEDTLVLLQN